MPSTSTITRLNAFHKIHKHNIIACVSCININAEKAAIFIMSSIITMMKARRVKQNYDCQIQLGASGKLG